MRKPDFTQCKNKGAYQLRDNCAADQHLCFRYIDSTIPLLPKFEISSLNQSSEAVQPGFCRTWSKTTENRFCRDATHKVYKSPIFKNICTWFCIHLTEMG